MITYATYATPRADLGEAFHEFTMDEMTLIASDILPDYSVQTEDGTISVITRENMRTEETERADGGAFNRIDITGEDLAYLCANYGLEIPITDRERRKYVRDFQVELEKIAILRMRMQLSREVRVKDLIFNTTTWTGAALYTDRSGTPWDTITTDIITDVSNAAEKVRANSGVKPNALIVGEAVAQDMTKNTGIKARFQQDALITVPLIRQNMVSIFGLTKLLVGDAVRNTADEGQTFVGADIWPSQYAMVARVAPGRASPLPTYCVGRTLRWRDMENNVEGAPEQYREVATKSEIYRVEDYLQEKVFDAYAGHLLKVNT
jgi:hypothetical protein